MGTHHHFVLLVDDDVMFCRSLTRSLLDYGFDVQSVHTVADALQFVAERQNSGNPLDVILLDWILPDRDGMTLLQDLRESGNLVPIIMLSAEGSTPGRVRALNRGADDYLPKPFDTEELVARINANLRRHTPVVISIGRITVDLWRQQVCVDGMRIDLTSMEFAILRCLAENPNVVVSRSRIMQMAWTDRGLHGSPKALNLQLLRLRRKLGSAANQVETIWGSGMRLSDAPPAPPKEAEPNPIDKFKRA